MPTYHSQHSHKTGLISTSSDSPKNQAVASLLKFIVSLSNQCLLATSPPLFPLLSLFLSFSIAAMTRKNPGPAYIVGVGMTKFMKPRGKVEYHELGFEAGVKAMMDASINYDDVDCGVACYCYGDSTCGQRVFYQFGLTRIPIYNVNNNCATGSTGLALARTMVSHGAADCALVIGFEKMAPGSLQSVYRDRENPTKLITMMMAQTRGTSITNVPGTTRMFGETGREYMEK
jgi:sterol carrier protein 2